MTKDEAAQIISRAILAEGNQQYILGADAFAARLATALDALGLLMLAADPQAAVQHTRPTIMPDTPVGSTGEGGGPEYWATKRQRV